MKDTVYISGPITGLDYEKAAAAFYVAESKIRSIYGTNVEVVNPVRLVPKGTKWDEAMRVCIEHLMKCKYIHMLPDFYKSRGARLEMTIAQELGFGVCNDEYNLVRYDG